METFLEIMIYVVVPVVFFTNVILLFIAARRKIRKTKRSDYKTYFSIQFYWFTVWVGAALVFIALKNLFFLPTQVWTFNPMALLGTALLIWLTATGCLYYFTGRVWPTKD